MSRLPVGYRFYWDSGCKLCNALKRLAVSLDWRKQVSFLPIQSEQGEIELGHMTLDERMASSHLIVPDGRIYSRGEGILGLAQLFPLTAPLVFCFRLLPKNKWLADKLYALVAENRGTIYSTGQLINFDRQPDPIVPSESDESKKPHGIDS